MPDDARTIEKRIAAIRETMRCTLDRNKLPAMREQLMVELVKLKALGGTVEDAGHNGPTPSR